MTKAKRQPGASQPRWDGRRVLFDVVQDGQRVPCAISLTALQDIAGLRRSKPADLLTCFVAARAQIEAAALNKLRRRGSGTAGVFNIWSEDFEAPPVAAPAPVPNDREQPGAD